MLTADPVELALCKTGAGPSNAELPPLGEVTKTRLPRGTSTCGLVRPQGCFDTVPPTAVSFDAEANGVAWILELADAGSAPPPSPAIPTTPAQRQALSDEGNPAGCSIFAGPKRLDTPSMMAWTLRGLAFAVGPLRRYRLGRARRHAPCHRVVPTRQGSEPSGQPSACVTGPRARVASCLRST